MHPNIKLSTLNISFFVIFNFMLFPFYKWQSFINLLYICLYTDRYVCVGVLSVVHMGLAWKLWSLFSPFDIFAVDALLFWHCLEYPKLAVLKLQADSSVSVSYLYLRVLWLWMHPTESSLSADFGRSNSGFQCCIASALAYLIFSSVSAWSLRTNCVDYNILPNFKRLNMPIRN